MNSPNKIKVSKDIKQLAEIFNNAGATLYIVGGYVRDSLLGNSPYDIDICSNLKVEEVKSILKSTGFKFKTKNANFGTATISSETQSYEYTCFREEQYKTNGEHTPTQVKFVKDITTDASRRDFYVNALYYDIINDKVADPLGKGLENLKSRILQVIPHKQCAFCEDAARILRLIKFSAMLDFEIEPETLKLAKQYSILLQNITDARFKKELGFIANISQEKQQKVNKLFDEIAPNIDNFKNI